MSTQFKNNTVIQVIKTMGIMLVLTVGIYGSMLFVVGNCSAASYPQSTATPLSIDLSMNQYKLIDVGDIITKGPWVDVRAFGAVGDGVADDTAAIQATIDSLPSDGGTVYLPAGTYNITNSITISGRYGVHFIGVGARATTLRWRGTNTIPLLYLKGVRDSSFKDFAIYSSPYYFLSVGIQSETLSGYTVTANLFENIWMEGGWQGMGKGFAFVTGTGGDNNNDMNEFRNVLISNYTIAAWSIGHAQSKGHKFFNCGWNAFRNGQYGIYGWGGYQCYGMAGGGCTVADFYVDSISDGIMVSGGSFEASNRLLYVGGPTIAYGLVLIQSVRWAANYLDADRRAIVMQTTGPLTLIENSFAYGDVKIYYNSGAKGSFTAIGNVIQNSLEPTPFEIGGQGAREFYFGNHKSNDVDYTLIPIGEKITGYLSLLATNGNVGSFVFAASAQTVVNNTSVTANSIIVLFPTNAAAATLVSGSKSPYISSKTAGASFTVRTANGQAAAGTETFNYIMFN